MSWNSPQAYTISLQCCKPFAVSDLHGDDLLLWMSTAFVALTSCNIESGLGCFSSSLLKEMRGEICVKPSHYLVCALIKDCSPAQWDLQSSHDKRSTRSAYQIGQQNRSQGSARSAGSTAHLSDFVQYFSPSHAWRRSALRSKWQCCYRGQPRL